VHLVLENDDNEARRLAGGARAPGRFRAQWNDDLHHCLHVLLTGEHDGYYADYVDAPLERLGRCLAEGFSYQGEASAHRDGAPRGEPSTQLPPLAFVAFLQNHDQVGNRALGDRIAALASPPAVQAATALVLLAPQVPLLFMGEELAARTPFPFFCDFGPELARAVTRGRRREFARFARFADEAARAAIPDPNDAATFHSARLDRSTPGGQEGRAAGTHLRLCRELLALRREHLVPHLDGHCAATSHDVTTSGILRVAWRFADGARLALHARLDDRPADLAGVELPARAPLHSLPADAPARAAGGALPPWSVIWHLDTGGGEVS
jgi:malto-oligosyltrehalose trehalohydrolase